ncbi:hypothetical protein [Streptomyces sp. NPDC059224]|uniref:hypothetical protein n=1 Tax=Streptomyces sp. NPDC059224 TaxID=3346775 RepID=UPI0036C408D1
MIWGLTLTGGLLGEAVSRTVFEHHSAMSVTSNFPVQVGEMKGRQRQARDTSDDRPPGQPVARRQAAMRRWR